MMKERAVVYLGCVEWAGLHQRPQQLARLLAEDRDVLYVNPVGLRTVRWQDLSRVWRYFTGRRRARAEAAVEVKSLLYIPVAGNPWVDAVNRRLWSWQLGRRLEPGYTLWVSAPSPLALSLLESTAPGQVIYDCMDHYAAFHEGPAAKRLAAAEEVLLRRADRVLASSEPLRRLLAERHANVELAPNGADVEVFLREARNEKPGRLEDIDSLEGPILGYSGSIGDWLDFGLLARVAREFPGCRLVLIGPWYAKGGRELLQLPNVHWLGEKPHAQVPGYCRRFSVGLIPFAFNEVTRYVNPIKLYEYLALGLPVVSAAIPDVLRHSAFVSAAGSADEFVAAVRSSLEPGQRQPERREQRMRYASGFTWKKVYESIRGGLDGMPRERQGVSA